ncbi:MAG: pilus assembly protein TadG-related protein [Actinomycetota bacterium]
MVKFRRSDRSDRGAVMIWFAASVVVSLGMGALVIDMGALWTERRQLQNGADAAAMAVAMDCAAGNCGTPLARAQEYANLNAADDVSNVDSLCGSMSPLAVCPPPPEAAGTSGFVEVIAGTRTSGGGSQIKYLLAPVLEGGKTGKHVTARAVAGWRAAGSGKVAAMVLSRCDALPLNGIRRVMFIATTPAQTCNDTKFQNIPQGFEFVQDGDKDCLVAISLLSVGGDKLPKDNEGNNPNCKALLNEAIATGQPLLFPIATGRQDVGSNATYTIDGFALVQLCGYDLPGTSTNGCCPKPIKGYRVCGTFVRGTLIDGDWGSGNNSDYGAYVVKLIG